MNGAIALSVSSFRYHLPPSFRRTPESSEALLVDKQPVVYILASKRNGTLYIGVTSGLIKRIWEHKNNLVEGFTKRYRVHNLVWYELHENMESAILREKTLKEWKRMWKLELIERSNPDWNDLYNTIL
jgi:putative endonuclease